MATFIATTAGDDRINGALHSPDWKVMGSILGRVNPKTYNTDIFDLNGKLSVCASVPSDGAPCHFPVMLHAYGNHNTKTKPTNKIHNFNEYSTASNLIILFGNVMVVAKIKFCYLGGLLNKKNKVK